MIRTSFVVLVSSSVFFFFLSFQLEGNGGEKGNSGGWYSATTSGALMGVNAMCKRAIAPTALLFSSLSLSLSFPIPFIPRAILRLLLGGKKGRKKREGGGRDDTTKKCIALRRVAESWGGGDFETASFIYLNATSWRYRARALLLLTSIGPSLKLATRESWKNCE